MKLLGGYFVLFCSICVFESLRVELGARIAKSGGVDSGLANMITIVHMYTL